MLRSKLNLLCQKHFHRLSCINNIYIHKPEIFNRNFNGYEGECLCGFFSWPENNFLPYMKCQIERYDKEIYNEFGIKEYGVECTSTKTETWTNMIKKLYPAQTNFQLTMNEHKKQLLFVSNLVPLVTNYTRLPCHQPHNEDVNSNIVNKYIGDCVTFAKTHNIERQIYPLLAQALIWQSQFMSNRETDINTVMRQYIEDYIVFVQNYKTDKKIHPTMEQALVWQSHLMSADEYRTDSKKMFGEILDLNILK